MTLEQVAADIQRMLTQFVPADDVCLALNMTRDGVDRVCQGAFGMSLADAERMFNAAGRAALAQAQFDAAMDGDRSMLIALGRQYLGQGDDAPKRESTKEATVFELVAGGYGDAPDRKRRAAR